MKTPTTRRENEVWQACDELWAMEGKKSSLTGDRIREKLTDQGFKKGSPNEIYKYRKTWETARNIALNAPETKAIQSLPDPISRAVTLVHEELAQKAQAEIAQIKEALETDIEKLKTENLGLKDSLKDTNAFLEKTGEELTLKNLAYSKLEAKWEENRLENIRLKESLSEKEIAQKSYEALSKTHHQELKAHFQDISVHKDATIHSLGQKLDARTLRLETFQKEEGARFSEALNALKVQNHNLEIALSNSETKGALTKQALEEKRKESKELTNQLWQLSAEQRSQQKTLEKITATQEDLSDKIDSKEQENLIRQDFKMLFKNIELLGGDLSNLKKLITAPPKPKNNSSQTKPDVSG